MNGSAADAEPSGPGAGPAAVAVVTGVLCAGLVTRAASSATAVGAALRTAPGARPDDVVGLAVIALGALVAGWYTVTALAVLLLRAGLGAGPVARGVLRWGAPLLRRAVVSSTAAGVGVAIAVTPGAATTLPVPAADRLPEIPQDLGWGAPAPEAFRPVARPEPTLTVAAAPQQGKDVPVAAPRGTYRVVAGDTLWDIAARELGPAATPARVAARWPRWHAANRHVIGPDPHLIHPGQVLTPPDEEPS